MIASNFRNEEYLKAPIVSIGTVCKEHYRNSPRLQLEKMERARYLRGERMRQQAEQAGDLRRRNQVSTV